MQGRNPNLEDPGTIQVILRRLCRDGGLVRLRFGTWTGEFPVQAIDEENILLPLPEVLRGQWGLKRHSRLDATLVDRGRGYEASLELISWLRFKGDPSCQFGLPRVLRALDPHRLADFVPEHPLPCLYSDGASNVVTGQASAFGLEGLEAGPLDGRDPARGLRIGAFSSMELALPGGHLVLPATVAYLERRVAGFLFHEPPREVMGPYQAWILEAQRAQTRRDLESLGPAGEEASPRSIEASAGPRILVASDRDPMILVISEGAFLSGRLAESLGRKFGVAWLDHVQGHVQSRVAEMPGGGSGWGRIRIVLVHQRLRVGSGMDLVRQLATEEGCPLPILLVGSEEDADLKRNRAIASGAVDFLPVEPFNAVRILRGLGETLSMFPGG
ncbi:MAG: hypothetical protein HY823_03410 [Acidobacteria bacterium]|nr:hypothetical protein [Acidobacteriota bacterium]